MSESFGKNSRPLDRIRILGERQKGHGQYVEQKQKINEAIEKLQDYLRVFYKLKIQLEKRIYSKDQLTRVLQILDIESTLFLSEENTEETPSLESFYDIAIDRLDQAIVSLDQQIKQYLDSMSELETRWSKKCEEIDEFLDDKYYDPENPDSPPQYLGNN